MFVIHTLGMRDRHMLVGVTFFLPRVRCLLFLLILWAADRPLRAVGEHAQFFEFGALLNDFFQRAALRPFGTDPHLS